jgi:hypothetical protein
VRSDQWCCTTVVFPVTVPGLADDLSDQTRLYSLAIADSIDRPPRLPSILPS